MEIITAITIILVLSMIIFQASSRSIEKARWIVDCGKMVSINSALISRSVENNDIAYTKQETGNSVYREWRDPMSLCQVLQDYLQGEDAWISPSANARHKRYKNSYAWSQGSNVSFDLDNPEKSNRVSQVEKPHATPTLWNNYGYTLPSGYNRPESNRVGPSLAAKNFHHRPWKGKSAINWIYLDGHVATF